MTRYQQVINILDQAIGGPGMNIAVHGAFWRNLTRDQFVAKKVQGLDLLVVGNGAGSNLIKALKGEAPFGDDLAMPLVQTLVEPLAAYRGRRPDNWSTRWHGSRRLSCRAFRRQDLFRINGACDNE